MNKSPLKAGKLALKANILDGLRDVIVLVNSSREIVDCNSAASTYIPQKIKGVRLEKVFPQREINEAVEKVLRGQRAGVCEVHLPFPISKTFEATATPLPSGILDKKGWVMLALHDVSAARQSEKIRSDFIANMSHELRSPLTTLTGLIESLQGPAKGNPEMQEKFLGIMEQEASRMRRLIDDLLSLSRVEANEHMVPEGEVDIYPLVCEVVEHLEHRAQQKNMKIKLVGSEKRPLVRGEYDEISQVFENLINNAVKYGTPGTTITISFEPVKRISLDGRAGIGTGGVAVSIKNLGEGIAAKHLQRITERFYRIDKGRSRAAGGTGLGLAIVKHILNRHRGRLGISSVEGKESTFTAYLPLAKKSEEKAKP